MPLEVSNRNKPVEPVLGPTRMALVALPNALFEPLATLPEYSMIPPMFSVVTPE